MPKFKDLTGLRFERLVVIERDTTPCPVSRWKCLCDCGNITSVRCNHLNNGSIRSCGCIRKEFLSNLSSTHKESKTRLYGLWSNIKSRCYNSNVPCFKHYGGRGIKVCDVWQTYEGFRDNLPDGYRDDLELDRIDVDGDYCKENCRWTTRSENCFNKRLNKDSGVSFCKRDLLWRATISCNGDRKVLYFKDYEEALNCRLKWELEVWGYNPPRELV